MYTDATLALKSASEQDLQAQRTRTESLSRVKLSPEEEKAKMRSASEGFEAVFIQQMWDQMRSSLPKDGLLQSKEEEQWQSMYSQELGKSMASAGGIGLADMMMEQLTRNREDLGTASRSAGPRRSGLEIAPAPLLSPNAAISPTAPALHPASQPASQAGMAKPEQASPLSPSLANIYDGEAVQPHGDSPEPETSGDGNLTARPAVGTSSEQAPAQAAESTPPSVRQTLDELTTMLLASGQEVPGLVSPAPNQNAPIVTRVTYTSNLPAGQRSGLDPVLLAELHQQNVQKNLAQNAQNPQNSQNLQAKTDQKGPAPALLGLSQPAPASAPAFVENIKPGMPSPEQDILAGIFTRFTPEQGLPQGQTLLAALDTQNAPLNASLNSSSHAPFNAYSQAPFNSLSSPAMAGTGLSGIQAQAGGPALRSPERVSHNVALGDPAPGLTEINAPVQGRISSGFGWRHDPLNGQRSWHAGVDIQARPGESVQSSRAGVVSFAGQHPELGNLVVVEHGDGLRTLYGHNATLSVKKGDSVGQGMELAKAGSSGRAAGTHVHFEVRRDDLALNPEPLLRQPLLQANSLSPDISQPTGVSHV